LGAAIGFVLSLTQVLLAPPTRDLAHLTMFPVISGGATVLMGWALQRIKMPVLFRSLRARLVITCMLTAVLALVNVGFTAVLMFISTHDLALLAGLLGFSLAISLLVALSISEPTLRSLRALTQAASRVSLGELNTRVPVESSDEVGDLALAFNSMAGQLEASVAKEQELIQTRGELVSAVSHDLRTPLASIRAMLESVIDGVVEDQDTVHRYLRNTLAEVENLGRLVDDLFEVARMDAGMLQLHIEEASLQDLTSDTLESMSAQAAARNLRLHGSVEEPIAPVVMDLRRVQRVLYNLVQNSIRHTPPDGTINITARDTGSQVQVEVADTGAGIPEQDSGRLFERSYRIDPSRSRTSGGAGLGLSIAKGIVEAHGGQIWATSVVGHPEQRSPPPANSR
jgi:signal transduction histidine kinase